MSASQRRLVLALAITMAAVPTLSVAASAQALVALPLNPGSPSEAIHLLTAGTTQTKDGKRVAAPGATWTYQIPLPAGARCFLRYEVEGSLAVRVKTRAGRTLPMALEGTQPALEARFTAPAALKAGEPLLLDLKAASLVELRSLTLLVSLPDRNGDGLPDAVAGWLGVPPDRRWASAPPSRRLAVGVVVGSEGDPSQAPPCGLAIWTGAGDPPVERWRSSGYGFGMRLDRQAGSAPPLSAVPSEPKTEVTPGTPSGAPEADGNPRPPLDAVVVDLPVAPARPAPDMAALRTTLDSVLVAARAMEGTPLRMLYAIPAPDAIRANVAGPLFSAVPLGLSQAVAGPVVTGLGPGVRLAGARGRSAFVEATLRVATLSAAVRGTPTPVWADFSALSGSSPLGQSEGASAIVGALQVPEVQGALLPSVTDAASVAVASAVTEALGSGRLEVTAGNPTVAVLMSDTSQLTGSEAIVAADRAEALAAPFIAHGVPVRAVAMERLNERSSLDGLRTLIVSFDALWPTMPEMSEAIARWVRQGGSLVCVGGVLQPGDSPAAFWRTAGRASALEDLLSRTGVPAARREVSGAQRPTDGVTGQVAVETTGDSGSFATRTVDLTALARAHGGAVVAIEPASLGEQTCALRSVELRLGTRLALAFLAGSELESRFLSYETGTEIADGARRSRSPGTWEYRFDNLPRDQSATLNLQVAGACRIRVRPPGPPQPVLAAADGSLDKPVSRVRLPLAYGFSLWTPPPGATTLSVVEGSGAAVAWRATAGAGSVTVIGVDPAALTSTAPLARWYRAIVASSIRASGGDYRESRAVTVRRGPLIGVQALGHDTTIEGRFVDLCDQRLSVVENPTIPAHRARLFVAAAIGAPTPRVVAASGRILGKIETPSATCFVVSGPSQSNSVVRLASGSRTCLGVRAATVLGRPVPCTMRQETGSVELRFAGATEGVAVRVAWR